MATAARPSQASSHPHARGQAGAKPKLDNPRHPERTLLYQTIAEHLETWLDLASPAQDSSIGQGDHHIPKPYVRPAGLSQIFEVSQSRARSDTTPPKKC